MWWPWPCWRCAVSEVWQSIEMRKALLCRNWHHGKVIFCFEIRERFGREGLESRPQQIGAVWIGSRRRFRSRVICYRPAHICQCSHQTHRSKRCGTEAPVRSRARLSRIAFADAVRAPNYPSSRSLRAFFAITFVLPRYSRSTISTPLYYYILFTLHPQIPCHSSRPARQMRCNDQHRELRPHDFAV